MASDLNPHFSFDVGEAAEPAQAPWEFTGALAQARQDEGRHKGTTIDQKIQNRLQQSKRRRPEPQAVKPATAARGGAKRKAQQEQADPGSDSGSDSGAESESDVSSSEELVAPAATIRVRTSGLTATADSEPDSSDAGGDSADADSQGDDGEEDDGAESADSEDEPLPGEVDEAGSSEEEDVLADSEADEVQRLMDEAGDSGSDEEDAGEGDSGSDEEAGFSGSEEEEEAGEEAARQRRGSGAGASTSAPAAQNGTGARGKLSQQRQQQQQQQHEGGGAAEELQGRSKRQKQAGGAGGGAFFAQTPDGTTFRMASFDELHLSRPLLKAVAALGFSQPTPIQAACIPLALTGRDIVGSAMTGSGKTAAFALPLLERLLFRDKRARVTYGLILAPTRELAVQVHSMTQKLAQATDIRVALAVGGLSLQAQAATLRTAPEIIVATPGRLIDHLRNTAAVGLEDLAVLVLDEADRLLEMGFKDEVEEVLRLTPRERQTLLFSATMTDEVEKLIRLTMAQPVRIAADPRAAAPAALQQEVVRLKGPAAAANKEAVLLALCSRALAGGRCIVFFRTKQRAHRAKMLFGLAGLPPAAELHGNMTQAARLASLEQFRKGEVAFLLATDVAARGLDILGVQSVVNFDAPDDAGAYLHRIGRTARAGQAGRAITLAEDGDRALLKQVMKKGGAGLAERVVPAAAVAQWARRIEGLAADIAQLVHEEAEETALRKAEMEATKAQNLMDHEAEILARPPRTWFQTERQKREAAQRGAAASEEAADEEEEARGAGGKGRKAKKDKGDKKAQAKAAAGAKAVKGPKAARNPLMEETAGLKAGIRAAKARAAALRQQGMAPALAGKAAAAAAGGGGKKAKKRAKGAPEGKGDGLFEGDGHSRPAGPARVYAGGGRSGKPKLPSSRLSKTDLNKVKRHGKGAKAFKSKARHKRRH